MGRELTVPSSNFSLVREHCRELRLHGTKQEIEALLEEAAVRAGFERRGRRSIRPLGFGAHLSFVRRVRGRSESTVALSWSTRFVLPYASIALVIGMVALSPLTTGLGSILRWLVPLTLPLVPMYFTHRALRKHIPAVEADLRAEIDLLLRDRVIAYAEDAPKRTGQLSVPPPSDELGSLSPPR